MSLSNVNTKIKRGVIWTAIDFAGKAVMQFTLQIVLARLLVPEDFGLIGMAVVFTTIIQAFVDFGLGAALVQMKEELITDNYLNTAFWSGFGLNIAVYLLVVFIIGPLAASFYGEPILVSIFPVLSLNIIINCFNMVQLVKLTRKMDFKKVAVINSVSNFIGVSGAIILAYLGFGVWSIVVHGPLVALAALPLYLIFNKWMPKRHWNKQEFKKIFSFGLFTSGTQLANSITSQADYLLIGKILDKQQLGAYSLAFQVTNVLKASLVGIVAKVMYPVYGKFQDDKEIVRKYYFEIIKFNMLFIAPIMVFLILYTDFIVNNIFGEKWVASIPIIKILAVASIIQVLESSNTSIIRGLGFPALEFKIQLYKTIFIYLPSIAIGVICFGLIGAAYAIVVSAIFSILIAMYNMNKLTGFTYYDLLKSIYKTCFTIVISTIAVSVFRSISTEEFFSMIIFLLSIIILTFFFNKKDIYALIRKNI